MTGGDFYEDDEPVSGIRRASETGAKGVTLPDGPAFRVTREHVEADGTRVVDEFELFGGVVKGRVDPDMPPDQIRLVTDCPGCGSSCPCCCICEYDDA